MAPGPAWMRTVAVPLRRVMFCRTVRRLLVLGGLLVAGWLLGGAGQAHAAGTPDPGAAAPRSVLGDAAERVDRLDDVATSALGGREGRRPPTRIAVRDLPRSEATPAPGASSPGRLRGAVRAALGDTLRAATRGSPVRPEINDLRGTIQRALTGVTSAVSSVDGAGSGLSWAPRHRGAAPVGHHGSAEAHSIGAAAGSGASKSIAGGRARPSCAHPAPSPVPDLPRPLAPQAGTMSPGGPAGGLGHVQRFWSAIRPALAGPPAMGVIPPVVRTAADEPTFSPD